MADRGRFAVAGLADVALAANGGGRDGDNGSDSGNASSDDHPATRTDKSCRGCVFNGAQPAG